MKRTIVNTMFTTGISIVGLTLYFAITDIKIVMVYTILQLLGANVLIHLGLFFRSKFEIQNIFLECLIEISYVIIVLVAFGFIFNWFVAIPVWILIISGIMIYIIAYVLTMSGIKKDMKEINKLLDKIQDI
jgi:hypothetical protein